MFNVIVEKKRNEDVGELTVVTNENLPGFENFPGGSCFVVKRNVSEEEANQIAGEISDGLISLSNGLMKNFSYKEIINKLFFNKEV